MRELITVMCTELMSSSLPLLIPTGNNIANVDPGIDCFVPNPNLTDSLLLQKLKMFGFFLGWSIAAIGALSLELPMPFWKRLCQGPTYVYSLEDLFEMDKYRKQLLDQIIDTADSVSEEDFLAGYEGTFFQADFGDGNIVDLCENGAEKQLTKGNAREYVQSYLEKFTQRDQPQFQLIYDCIQFVVGKRMMLFMTPQILAKRAVAPQIISISALKASTDTDNEKLRPELKTWFWEIMEEMSNDDRQLFLKFTCGRTRLQPGVKQRIDFGYIEFSKDEEEKKA